MLQSSWGKQIVKKSSDSYRAGTNERDNSLSIKLLFGRRKKNAGPERLMSEIRIRVSVSVPGNGTRRTVEDRGRNKFNNKHGLSHRIHINLKLVVGSTPCLRKVWVCSCHSSCAQQMELWKGQQDTSA